MLRSAAEHVKALLDQKPVAVLALSSGPDCLALYEELAKMYTAGEISFKDARFFAVAAFCGRKDMSLSAFLQRTDAKDDNIVFLSEENFETYDDLIEKQGGIDLAVLDLGLNGRIGFNEPATPFDSLTHRQKITDSSKRELTESFKTPEDLPEFALTMGIKTLVSARDIIVISSGESRADAVFKMLYGRNDSVVPAAFLQIPLNVTAYLDTASAQKL